MPNCFSEDNFISYRFNKFQQQQELWNEVEKVTAALRSESETVESEIQFLCEMFKHIPMGKYKFSFTGDFYY